MMTGVIRVFDYAGNESFDVHFAGYWYSGYNWTNCSAWIDSQANVDRNFTVRWGSMTGYDGAGSRPFISIGSATTTWSYVKFSVINFEPGHSNAQAYKWDSGWEMDLSTTLPGSSLRDTSTTQSNNWARNGQDVYYGSGSGNVGIGTTNPGTLHGVTYGTTKLHVDGGTDRGQMIIEGDSFAGIVLSDNGTTANERVFATTVDGGKYAIKPLNDNGTSTAGGVAITALHNSNVGIGTTDPDTKLEVRTDSGAATANSYFRVTAGAQGAYGGISHFEGAYNDYGNVNQPNIVGKIDMASEVITPTDVGGTMKFFTKATGGTYATAPLERMRITSTGAISVGSTGTNYGTSGEVLISNGNGSPTWGAATSATEDGYYKIDDGLNFYLAFKEGSGTTVADVSGGRNNFVAGLGLDWSETGRFGYAQSFNGSNSYLSGTGPSSNITTFSAWVNNDGDGGIQNIVSGDYIMSYVSIYNNNFQMYDGVGWRNGGAVPANEWVHVAFSYDAAGTSGGLHKMYVNGVLGYSATAVGYTGVASYISKVGIYVSGIRYFNGEITAIQTWGRILGDLEILAVYNQTALNQNLSVLGNVGIGNSTSTINGKLEVQQTATTPALWAQTGGTTDAYTIADFRTGTNLPALAIKGDGNSTFGGTINVNTRQALKSSIWGYSSSYRTLILGSAGTDYQTDAVTIAFGVDVSANTSGSFTGNGSELIFRNVTRFKTQTTGLNAYQNPLTLYNGNVHLEGEVGIGTTTTTGGFNVNVPSGINGSYYNMSNADSGNYKYTNPGGRLLTSNGTNWAADGRDPILTLASDGNSNNANQIGYSVGLNLYSNTATDNTYSPLIAFSNLSNSGNYATMYAAIMGKKTGVGTDTNWSTGELQFFTSGPAASGSASYMSNIPEMVINSSGSVGIGTASPGSKLEIAAANTNQLGMLRITPGATAAYGLDVGLDPTYGDPVFSAIVNNVVTESFRIQRSTGNVAIKLASVPAYTLQVGGSFRAEGASTGQSVSFGGAGDFGIDAPGVGNGRFVVKHSSGFVGIGIPAPGRQLDVDGAIRGTEYNLTGNVGNPAGTAATIYDQQNVGLTLSAHNISFRNYNGTAMMESARLIHTSLTVAGDVIAYGSPSDVRLKENIKPIESALDKAMKLQGVTFDWKQKEDSILELKEDIGFIAQDVQKVVPELVRENEDGMLSMRHQGIAPILLEAIKELKAEIDLLKSKPCTCNKCNCNI
jgi:hypothetical protein